MFLQPRLIAPAQSLGAAGDHAVLAFARGELGAAGIGQRLLGGIEHLHEMAAHPLRRDLLQPRAGLRHRLEKIAEQETFGEAAEAWRAAAGSPRPVVAHEDLSDAPGRIAAPVWQAADQADALAAAGEKLGQSERQHDRAAFLGGSATGTSGSASTATDPPTARRCAQPPIRARARRDGRSSPSGASRCRAAGRSGRNGGTARRSRPGPRGAGRGCRGRRYGRRAATR